MNDYTEKNITSNYSGRKPSDATSDVKRQTSNDSVVKEKRGWDSELKKWVPMSNILKNKDSKNGSAQNNKRKRN